tara:strand:+ start:57 stop:269 length:213 start_codon:yes stop_codon:yes gene_type:complete
MKINGDRTTLTCGCCRKSVVVHNDYNENGVRVTGDNRPLNGWMINHAYTIDGIEYRTVMKQMAHKERNEA